MREEAGVAVGPVHILGSQPWPVGEAPPVCVPHLPGLSAASRALADPPIPHCFLVGLGNCLP